MCGIAGFIDPNVDKGEFFINKMMNSISHRGPDSRGYFEDSELGVYLANTRLSIIDIAGSHQPIIDNELGKVLVFNGEIYNFKELREELKLNGYKFHTDGDSEVIIKAHDYWGNEAPQKFRGMFAYALWDVKDKKLSLVRDHFGVKPLYFFKKNKTFIFGSEIKSILCHDQVDKLINNQSVMDCLNLRYLSSNESMFQNINKVPSGSILQIQSEEMSLHKYYQTNLKIDHTKSKSYWINGIRDRLDNAVDYSTTSDVDIGLFLSGGLDSTSILGTLKNLGHESIQCFTVAFNEPTDENKFAEKTANYYGYQHETIFAEKNTISNLPLAIFHCEEPKINSLQGMILSSSVSKRVKVALGGIAGDELFGGYWHYQFLRCFQYISFLSGLTNFNLLDKVRNSLNPLNGNFSFDKYKRVMQMALSLHQPEVFYGISRNCWDLNEDAKKNFFDQKFLDLQSYNPSLREYQDIFHKTYGTVLEKGMFAEFMLKLRDDFLVNDDRTSMAYSLETRPVFLDKDLADFAMRMPGKNKISSTLELRPLFKEIVSDRVPDFVLNKPKWGFAINPVEQWDKDLKSAASSFLTKKRVLDLGYIKWDIVKKLINLPTHKKYLWHYGIVWQLISLHLWFEIFINGKYPNESSLLKDYY